MKPGAVLATNTSSLRLEDIAKPLAGSGPACSAAFLQSRGAASSGRSGARRGDERRRGEEGRAFVTAIKKLPLIVKSCPGFLVNRVLTPYMMEAVRRYERRHAARQDRSGRAQIRHADGPARARWTWSVSTSPIMSATELGSAPAGQSAVAPGERRQARQEDRRGLLRLGEGQAETRGDTVTTRPSSTGLAASWSSRCSTNASARLPTDRRQCRPRRCRRDFRHRLCALPRRPAALSPRKSRRHGAVKQREPARETSSHHDGTRNCGVSRCLAG